MKKTLEKSTRAVGDSVQRLVRPVEVKHGMVVADLLDSQNLSAQKRKDAAARKGMISLSDIWPNVRGDSCAESALSPPPCSGLLWFFGLLRPTCVKDWLAVIALAVALLAWFRPQWEPWLRADTPTRGNPETMTEAR